MEMTARRMAGIALAAFALLVVVRPPRPTGRTYEDAMRRESAADRVRRALEATGDTLRAIEYAQWSREFRSGINRQLAALPSRERDRLHVDPRLPESLRRHLETVYLETRARMPRGAMALPMFVTVDTSQSSRYGNMLWIERPDGTAPACVTVLRVRISVQALDDPRVIAREVHRSFPSGFPQARHFGLCGFEAAFGPPSPAMRQWLRERDYRPVASGYDPSRPPRRSPRLRDNLIPWYLRGDNGAQALELRACASGRANHCLGAISPTWPRPVADVDTPSSDWRWYRWGYTDALDVMNTLASSMGTERFATLWRADEEPDKAYRRITGVPIDTLAQRVLLGESPPLRAGASVSLADVVITLAIALFFAGLAAFANPRRFRA